MKKGIVNILVGLPGSGKTYWASSQKDKYAKFLIVDCDTLEQVYHKNYMNRIYDNIANNFYGNYDNSFIIIDGLFLTNNSIVKVINSLGPLKKNFKFILHIWNEDRDTCLKNDNGRRKNASTTMIKTGVFEQIDLNSIKTQTGLNINTQKHVVELKPDWAFFADEQKNVKDGKLCSNTWIISCSSDFYTPELQPKDFLELDELLEKIYPTITYLQYKKLFRECVSIETIYDYEYYVGDITKGRYVCDIEKFYNLIGNFKKN